MKVFSRDYIIRKGSNFSVEILLSDIYVSLDEGTTYTVEGGMKLIADSSENAVITGELSASNTILTLSMTAAETTAIIIAGNYNYGIDIAAAGVVQTILEGTILVKEDVSDAT